MEYPEQTYFKPDMTAAIFLLKNWGNYVNEPQVVELRRQELELQRQKLKDSEW